MLQLAASDHYPAEVYPRLLPIFIRSSTLLHSVYRMFTFDVGKCAPPGAECNSAHIPDGAQMDPQATNPSATSSAWSRTSSPKRRSASPMFSGGTTWIRLKFANGRTPPDLRAATTAFISGELPP